MHTFALIALIVGCPAWLAGYTWMQVSVMHGRFDKKPIKMEAPHV